MAEIWQAIAARRRVGRTTILNLVDRLEKRGWLVRRDRQKPCHYLAALGREETAAFWPTASSKTFRRIGRQPHHEPVGLAAAETAGDRATAASAGSRSETVPREKGEIAMSSLVAIMPPAEAVSYLVNLAVAVSVVCGVGLLAARVCRHGSAPLRHGILLWTLVLMLLSPAAVWLAEQSGSGNRSPRNFRPVRCARSRHCQGDDSPRIAEPARAQPANGFTAGDRPSLGLPRNRMGMPSELRFSDRPGNAAGRAVPVVASEASRSVTGRIIAVVAGRVSALGLVASGRGLAALLWALGTAVALLRLGWGCLAWRGSAAGSPRYRTAGRRLRHVKRPMPWGCGSRRRCFSHAG